MIDQAHNPFELATTQLLPYLSVPRNEEAWRVFVVRYRPRIMSWCRKIQPDDAEEVVSRVLQKLVTGLARGAYKRQAPGLFRAWLRTVVLNEVVDLVRRRKSQGNTTELDECPDPVSLDALTEELDEQFHADYARAERVCHRVRSRVLPQTWEAFSRTYLHGQDARDVAKQLGLTLSGIYKARGRVRGLLEEEGNAQTPNPR